MCGAKKLLSSLSKRFSRKESVSTLDTAEDVCTRYDTSASTSSGRNARLLCRMPLSSEKMRERTCSRSAPFSFTPTVSPVPARIHTSDE